MLCANHNAIHEAGHVTAALCCELDVRAVLIKPTGKYTTRCELIPTQAAPRAVYAMKLAGAIAVQIQNERKERTDDDGFGETDDIESDAHCISILRSYWMSLGMTHDHVEECHMKLAAFVRAALSQHWLIVEALGAEITILKPSGPPLSAARIGDIAKAIDATFYNQVKVHLRTD